MPTMQRPYISHRRILHDRQHHLTIMLDVRVAKHGNNRPAKETQQGTMAGKINVIQKTAQE